MRLFLAAAFALATTPVLAQAPVTTGEVISAAIEDFIRPGFHELATSAASMKDGIAALCATPSEEHLSVGRDGFKAVVLAYSGVEFVHVGPLGSNNRIERMLFWPDRKGIALKQVQQALAAEDASATNPKDLAGKSVAMQGLGALEYLLFGTGAEELAGSGGAYRCSFAASIAALIGEVTAEMDGEWSDPQGISAALENPRPDANDYRTQTEVLEKLAASLVHGTEAIRDQRVLPILGTSAGQPKPKSALFWRSGMTVPALAANFSGLSDFFAKARFPEVMGADNAWIANGAEFEFANAKRALAVITSPMDEAVADPKQFKALEYLVIVTKSLDTLVGEDLSAALGLSVGFSALDGD